MAKKKIGIIGGGIVGTDLGYNLSLYDNADVTVFEKSQIGSEQPPNRPERSACLTIH